MSITKSWQTTLAGCLLAVGNLALTMVQSGTVNPKELLVSAGFAVLGILMKDWNVTGGTR